MSPTPQHAQLIAKGRVVALEGVRVDATLRGTGLDVTVTQRFCNAETVPIEAVYVFPLEEGAAVCGFAALIDGRVVRGRVEEREKAFAVYDDALIDGHAAMLLDQERSDVFTASVGSIKPGERIELQIRYVALARREGDAIRVSIPTTVSPRYVPGHQPLAAGQSDGERVNPERWPSVPYGLALSLDIALGGPLAGIESPSHPIRTTLCDSGAQIELSQDNAALDRDVVVLVTPRDAGRPGAIVAREDDGSHVAMITFMPTVEKDDRGLDVVFLLDCSGSMQGSSIDEAERALQLCIRALTPNDRFDVVRFGSTYESMWGAPRPFTQQNLDEASQYIAGVSADLGGTEMLAPLETILGRKRELRVILLTDGQVSNEDEVIALAHAHATHARMFTFGIGNAPSEHLVRSLARVTGGGAEMIAPGERLEPKVMRTFARVRSRAIGEVTIDWGVTAEMAPRRPQILYTGDVCTVLARIASGSPREVSLLVGAQRYTVPLDFAQAVVGGPLPTLWARERIRELEDGATPRGSAQRRPERDTRREAQLVELGQRYGLVSSAASYVVVAERAQGEQTTAPAALRKIPIGWTKGWGGTRNGGRDLFWQQATLSRAHMSFALPTAPAASMRASHRVTEPTQVPKAEAARQQAARRAADRERNDVLLAVLMTQRADGSFGRSPTLAALVGPIIDRVDAVAAEYDDAVLITAVVIYCVEKSYPGRRDEWGLAVEKARAFLAGRGSEIAVERVLSG
ncbi:MAG: VIT domain-containing protein [Gemmatimonadaceae bacterium]|nr:VIT domain-containing protein [Gemmatimonadaceae bacterium]